jgi:hypothetical protein
MIHSASTRDASGGTRRLVIGPIASLQVGGAIACVEATPILRAL